MLRADQFPSQTYRYMAVIIHAVKNGATSMG